MPPCRYEYFHLPRITEAQIKNSVELVLAASFSSSEGYSEWVAARPELLLIKVSLAGRAGSYLGKGVLACACGKFPIKCESMPQCLALQWGWL